MRSIGKALIQAATNKAPVPYTSTRPSILGGLLRSSSATAQMQAMGSVGTLYAIINAKSEATSQVDWKLYRKADSGNKEDRTEVTRHLALKIWNKPNRFYTRQELVESFCQHLDLVGEGWLLVERDRRVTFPTGLWMMRPDRMTPVEHPTEFLSGYVYTGPDGEKVPLELDEVIQLKMPNPLDPHRGMGPVQSILTDLDSTTYSAEWNRNFFRNSATPGGIIEIDKDTNPGDEELRQLQQRWNEKYGGTGNAHKVAVLTPGLKWVNHTFTQRDMQFAELRGVSREVIREAFRFPKAMLGTVDDVNRANAEANEVVFARWLIKPALERIKQMLNNDFLPMFGTAAEGLEFDYENPVPDDVELEAKLLTARSTAAKDLVDAGWDPAGVLSAVGLPDMDFVGPRITAPPVQPAQPALEPALEPASGGEPA